MKSTRSKESLSGWRRQTSAVLLLAFCAVVTADLRAQSLTTVQQSIVNAARGSSGAAPQSHVSFVWNGVTKQTWLTDTASGDGGRVRTAVNRFAQWRSANRGKPVPSTLTAAMRADLYTYNSSDATNLVNRIITTWDTKTAQCLCSLAPPQTDEQTLVFLGMRQQCKEWVDTVVIKAGGTPRAYGTGIQYTPANFRPGMGLYFTSPQHASIITDIYRNPDGSVKQFKIAESNWGSGWSNPSGMVPWSRTIQNARVLDWLGNNSCRDTGTNKTYACQVVSFQ